MYFCFEKNDLLLGLLKLNDSDIEKQKPFKTDLIFKVSIFIF